MSRISAALHMALGGAAAGTFLGIFAGGSLGLLWAWFTGDATAGLDWAVLGGGLFCVGGGLCGLLLALRGEPTEPVARGEVDRDSANGHQDNSSPTEGSGFTGSPSHQEHTPCEV